MAGKIESYNGNGSSPIPKSKSKNKFSGKSHRSSESLTEPENYLVVPENNIIEIITTVSNAGKRYLKIGQNYIRMNPIKGMTLALSAGFIAGSLFTGIFSRGRKT